MIWTTLARLAKIWHHHNTKTMLLITRC